MKIESVREAFVSDYEVLQFLSQLEREHNWVPELQGGRDANGKRRRPYNLPQLQKITRDTVHYLSLSKNATEAEEGESGQSKASNSHLARLNDAKFRELMATLNGFELFKAEKLQIVNQLPTNMVHLYSIVEECDSRFSENQTAVMIDAVQKACAV
ncbi:LAMI_0A07514g1_1 [Lachancea mirantina]|uniref:DNA-directed RNA polymerase III subunit RPC9 n=1 Tax=Lachancea mirantina TaxID=1230905 RepID=A0A1G4IQY2_9SACH|nr:LAMI_0A07514g1_1 [Lachancea mirantina]